MLKDKVEDFFKENREQLDVEIPDARIFEQLDRDLYGQERQSHWRAWAIAASIVLLVGFGFWEGYWFARPSDMAMSNAAKTQLKALSTPYQAQFIKELERITKTPITEVDISYFEPFIRQIKAIDKEIVVTQKAYFEQHTSEGMLQSIMKLHQKKMEVLKRLNRAIRQINQLKNPQDHDKVVQYINL